MLGLQDPLDQADSANISQLIFIGIQLTISKINCSQTGMILYQHSQLISMILPTQLIIPHHQAYYPTILPNRIKNRLQICLKLVATQV